MRNDNSGIDHGFLDLHYVASVFIYVREVCRIANCEDSVFVNNFVRDRRGSYSV